MRLALPELEVTPHILPNGFEILIGEDHAHPVASIQIRCRRGSIHEAPALGSGMAHFVEHMLFKGTTTRHYTELASGIQAVGGQVNAYTTFDHTSYYIDVPSPGVETCLDILGDMITNSTFPEEEFLKEQEVIRREFAMGRDDPDNELGELTFATAFREHPMRHPVFGHLDVFNQITRESLFAFYQRHYTPANLFLCVTGDVDAAAILAKAESLFGKLPRVADDPPVVPPEPPFSGRRDIRRTFDTELTRLTLAWHIPGLSHADHPALSLLAAILGDGDSSRLYQSLREEKGTALDIEAYLYTPGITGLFFIDAEAEPEESEKLIEQILVELKRLAEDGITPAEWEKARSRALAASFRRLATVSGQASAIAGGWLLARNTRLSRDYLHRLQETSPEQIQSVAKRYLTEDALTTAMLCPKMDKKSRKKRTPKPQTTETIRETLPGGMPLLMIPDRRLPLLWMGAGFRGGMLADPLGKEGLAEMIANTWFKGAGDRSANDIAESIEGRGGSFDASCGTNTLMASLSLMAPDSTMGCEILNDIIRRPHWNHGAFLREQEGQLAAILEDEDNLVTVALNSLRSSVFGPHRLATSRLGTEASVTSLQSTDLEPLANQLFNPSNGVIAVAGDFDPSEIHDRLAGLWESAPSPYRFESQPFVPCPPSVPLIKEIRRDKEQAVLAVGYPTFGVLSPDHLALTLLDEACSDMSSRLFLRIREEQGLAYFVGAGLIPGLSGGMFYFYLGTSPEKLPLAEKLLLDEIEWITRKGLQEDEWQRAKASLTGKLALSNQRTSKLAQAAMVDTLLGLGHEYHRKLPALIQAITVEELHEAAFRILSQTPCVTRILPEK